MPGWFVIGLVLLVAGAVNDDLFTHLCAANPSDFLASQFSSKCARNSCSGYIDVLSTGASVRAILGDHGSRAQELTAVGPQHRSSDCAPVNLGVRSGAPLHQNPSFFHTKSVDMESTSPDPASFP
jgi:hypothetical protein